MTQIKNQAPLTKVIRQESPNHSQCIDTTKGISRKKRDLSKYAGSWTQKEYEDFKKETEIFNQIDLDELN